MSKVGKPYRKLIDILNEQLTQIQDADTIIAKAQKGITSAYEDSWPDKNDAAQLLGFMYTANQMKEYRQSAKSKKFPEITAIQESFKEYIKSIYPKK